MWGVDVCVFVCVDVWGVWGVGGYIIQMLNYAVVPYWILLKAIHL